MENNIDIKQNTPVLQEKWRYIVLIIIAFLAYTATYVGKYSYAASINFVIDHFGVTLSEAGLVESCLFISYGVGQIVNGILCRFYNVKWSVFGGLLIIVAMNFLLPWVPFSLFAVLWVFMGIGASFLWTSLVRLLSDNLPESLLDTAILVMSAPMALGTLIIYGTGAGFSSAKLDIDLFYFAGGFVLLVAIIWMVLLPLTKAKIKAPKMSHEKTAPKEKTSSPWLAYASFFILIGLMAIIVNLVKDGAQTWIPRVLKDSYGFSNSISSLLTMVMPLAGVLGAFLGVMIHKKVKNYVALILIFLLLSSLSLGLIYFFYAGSAPLLVVSMSFLSCFMYSANNIITNMIPLYLRDKFPSGLLAGLIDGLCYLGSALSSLGLGAIGDHGGWNTVFLVLWILLICLSFLTIVYLAISRFKKPGSSKPKSN